MIKINHLSGFLLSKVFLVFFDEDQSINNSQQNTVTGDRLDLILTVIE